MIDRAKILELTRAHGRTVALEAMINFILPFLIYELTKRSLGDVHALMVSSAPPTLWTLFEFARHRRIDAVSLLVLSGIALSLLAYLGGGSAHLLQLREKLVTAAIGLVFLGSAAIGRPLIYQLARASILRKTPHEVEAFEELRDNRFFRRSMMVMTLVWGFGLLADAAVSAVLVFALSIQAYLLIGPFVGYGTMGGLGLWTFWYSRRQQARGRARIAAETAGSAGAASATMPGSAQTPPVRLPT